MALKEIGLREAIMTAGLESGEVYALHRITADTPIRELQAAKFVLFTEEGEPPKVELPVDNLKPKKKASTEAVGKMVALYKAGWSATKIADEMRCATQTVINHLTDAGVYKTREQKKEAATDDGKTE